MAAAMKMDELLVTWLGSDTVYEEVLTLIETHRASTPSSSVLSPPGSPTRRAAKQLAVDDDSTSLRSKDNDSVENTNNKNFDDDGTHTTTTNSTNNRQIPPFYRPPGTYDADGTKAPPLRRKRKDGFENDQSWDGSFAANDKGEGGGIEGMVPPPPPRESSEVDGDAKSVCTFMVIPIRDQVAAIFKDLGKRLDDDNDDEDDNIATTPPTSPNSATTHKTEEDTPTPPGGDASSSVTNKYLTMDNFVKITKDICSFPTFFNGPLYRRILYLWNTRNMPISSTTQRMDLWKVYDETKDIASVLGVEPPSSPKETKGEDNAAGLSKKSKSGDSEGTNGDENSSTKEANNESADNAKSLEDLRLKRKEYVTAAGGDVLITYEMFQWFWLEEMEDFDLSERFYRLVKKPHRDFVGREDFSPYIKELLRDHPGLEFLSNHAEFQDKYAVTVITRIFYTVNKCHSGRITARQIRRSDLLSAFQQVDEEEDINKVTRYFSYEHFYVLYCRFWELDHDRDYKIVRDDLLKYGDQCLSHMIVDRIFDAAPRPFEGGGKGEEDGVDESKDADGEDGAGSNADGAGEGDNNKSKSKDGGNNGGVREYLTYEDFIFFMLSEEDKANEISVRYWFSCIDVDGDGKLNNMEMRSFYALQQHRMQSLNHEHIPFEDMLCQMIDMIKPANNDYLIVEDFLQTECFQVSGALFDALFNLNKYMQFEQRDPFQERQKREDEFETDWDRFACMDYNRLAMEEEAREEDGLEIDWVTVEDDDDEAEDFSLGGGLGAASEAPF